MSITLTINVNTAEELTFKIAELAAAHGLFNQVAAQTHTCACMQVAPVSEEEGSDTYSDDSDDTTTAPVAPVDETPADDSAASTDAPAAAENKIPSSLKNLDEGDRVTVSGTLYSGGGYVKEIDLNTPFNEFIRVKADNGKSYKYNYNDLVAGKVTAA